PRDRLRRAAVHGEIPRRSSAPTARQGLSMKAWKARRVLVAAAAGAALLALTGSAIGAGGKGSAKAKLSIKGKDSFKPNAYLKFGEFFAPGTVTIRSGGTVTLTNKTV